MVGMLTHRLFASLLDEYELVTTADHFMPIDMSVDNKANDVKVLLNSEQSVLGCSRFSPTNHERSGVISNNKSGITELVNLNSHSVETEISNSNIILSSNSNSKRRRLTRSDIDKAQRERADAMFGVSAIKPLAIPLKELIPIRTVFFLPPGGMLV